MTIDRLNYHAQTEQEVFQYYRVRALQLASEGYAWSRSICRIHGGFLTSFQDRDGKHYSSFYITERGSGYAKRALSVCQDPILTIQDCNIVEFLSSQKAAFRVVSGAFDYPEYKMIEQFYGSDRARRSQALLMNHIDEGVYILKTLGASEDAIRAFCIHPLTQTDTELSMFLDQVCTLSPRVVALALEYRNKANNWLSPKVETPSKLIGMPELSPLEEVNDMLRADKIQNYKDFLLYHKGTHDRSEHLDIYFRTWLNALAIDDFDQWFQQLVTINPVDGAA